MITDADIKKLKTVFATKDDMNEMKGGISGIKHNLNRFATKDDLKRFATKDDLNRFATKDDLKRFATKDDLNRFATKDDLHEMKEEIITEVIDEIVGSIKPEILKIYELLGHSTEREDELQTEQKGQRVAIGDHEERIRLLEQAQHA